METKEMETKEKEFIIYLNFRISHCEKEISKFKDELKKVKGNNLTELFRWSSEDVITSAHEYYILEIIKKSYEKDGFAGAIKTMDYWIDRIKDNLYRMDVMNSAGIFHDAVKLTQLKAEADMVKSGILSNLIW